MRTPRHERPQMEPGARRELLERNLRAPGREALRDVEGAAFDHLRSVVRDMRSRAWQLREAQRVFGESRLTQTVVRRLEAFGDKLERCLERSLLDAEAEIRRRSEEEERVRKRQTRRERDRLRRLREWTDVADAADARAIADGHPRCRSTVWAADGTEAACCRKEGHWGYHVLPAHLRPAEPDPSDLPHGTLRVRVRSRKSGPTEGPGEGVEE